MKISLMKKTADKIKFLLLTRRTLVLTTLSALFVSFPLFTTAAGLVPCGPGTSKPTCTYCDLFVLIQSVIKFAFSFSLVLGTIFIIVGGFKILTAGESPSRVDEGKSTIIAAVVGIAIALGAWLIVDTVMKAITGSPLGPWNSISCS